MPRLDVQTWTWPDGHVTQTATLVAACPAGCGDVALWAGPYAPSGAKKDRFSPHRHLAASYRCWWSGASLDEGS